MTTTAHTTPIDSNSIRNIALLDHEGAGETTLIESLLHTAGVIRQMGQIGHHNTVSDFDPDEQAMEKSLYCSTLSFPWREHHFNCLDVPGGSDAIGEAMSALHAVEGALVCVDAIDGVRSNTRRLWRLAARRNLPRLIAITKLDADKADFDATLAAIQSAFGERCIPLYRPEGAGFTAITSMLEARDEALIEAIVESDDRLMERYLEGEAIETTELAAALKSAVLHGSLFPVIPTSAADEIGTEALLQALAELMPAPGTVEWPLYRCEEMIDAAELDGFAGFVYHTESDEFAGRLAYVRILSGRLSAHDTLLNRRSGEEVKATHLLRIVGKQQQDIEQATAGDIIALPRIEDLHAGDLLVSDPLAGAGAIAIDAIDFPKPMAALAVRPHTNRDSQKLSTALQEFANDDRTFHVHNDERTHDLIISGMSEQHLQLMLTRLQRRYKIEIDTAPPQVPYMETITGRASGIEYTHKKQSGGAGQYARVVIDLTPLPRGQGYRFSDKIHGGVIDAVFRPSVDKGAQQAMHEGVLAGFPVTDVELTLTDGKTHPVDSKDIAFQIAGQKAFRDAFMQCRPVLLEPIMKLTVSVPEDHLGDILGDLNSHRGQILATDIREGTAIVEALAPMAEIQSYQTQLTSMTAGEGAFSQELDHYDIVPPAIQKRIVEAKAKG